MKTYICKKTVIVFILSLFILNSNAFAEEINNKENSESKNFKTLTSSLLLLNNYYRYDLSPKSRTTLVPNKIEGNSVSYKSTWLAFFLSYIFPSGGQFYNGEYGKALIMVGLEVLGFGSLLLAATSINYDSESNPDYIGGFLYSGLAICGGTWLWSIIDAPVSANKINSRNKQLSGIKVFSSQNKKYSINLDYQNLNESCLIKIRLNF